MIEEIPLLIHLVNKGAFPTMKLWSMVASQILVIFPHCAAVSKDLLSGTHLMSEELQLFAPFWSKCF